MHRPTNLIHEYGDSQTGSVEWACDIQVLHKAMENWQSSGEQLEFGLVEGYF